MSENPVVGPRASVFSTGKDGEAGDIYVYRRYSRTQSSRTAPALIRQWLRSNKKNTSRKQAARSQIGFSDRLLERI
ncbi:MAG: hypothetical protein HQ515_09295 [Phycisphaeraceae bacterium]|nr:hypothetical protein [Phycisphaeraceae bacterium]